MNCSQLDVEMVSDQKSVTSHLIVPNDTILIFFHRLPEQGLRRLDVAYCVVLFRIGKGSTGGCGDGVAVSSRAASARLKASTVWG